MNEAHQVSGKNRAAPFTLKLHRGDGMLLIAMNWKQGAPPKDFVGFAIEYKEPGGSKFFPLRNRISFADANGKVSPAALSSRFSPIQKFRWVHFPRNAEKDGPFTYRVTPVFMNSKEELSYGEHQEAAIVLRRVTYPGKLNVAFTRGFVSSQAFVDRYGAEAIPKLLPAKADDGLQFKSTLAEAEQALAWMGFEARSAILEVLDQAIADKTAEVCAAVYDLNEPAIVNRYKALGKRLRIIIDNDGAHGKRGSAETRAAALLAKSAGANHVKRQHMGKLQHNKIIVINGRKVQAAVCGSTNHSWRGLFVQNNNAIVVHGAKPVAVFKAAFENYWNVANDSVAAFSSTQSAGWNDLKLRGIDVVAAFSPRSKANAILGGIAQDIASAESSLLFSLAFLYQTPGAVLKAIQKLKKDKRVFSYGISDRRVKGLADKASGIDVQKPDGTVTTVNPAALTRDAPEPFKSEPTGGSGARLHHKFVVIDFDKPTARVYMGSFNFSDAADTKNGENLLLIRDQRIAVSYAVEAIRLFDHYHFRLAQQMAKAKKKKLQLAKPPRKKGEKAWWADDYETPRKIRDRELFA
jgi:phosphatidylserine/phosphatidylglycerophosphate/cardiolipin synthase-like enzyme